MIGVIQKNWQVIEETQPLGKNSSRSVWWNCKCLKCGKIKTFNGAEIRLHRIGQCNCNKNKNKEKTIKKFNSRIKDETGNKYGQLIVQSFAYSKDSFAYWNCLCNCGKKTIVRGNHLRTGRIKSCGCIISYQEQEIEKILIKHNIIFKREFSFPDLKDVNFLRFDFAIFNEFNTLKGLIEYHGKQHYQDFNKFNHFGLLQQHDKMKKEYCIKNNIPLLILNKDNILSLEQDILLFSK